MEETCFDSKIRVGSPTAGGKRLRSVTVRVQIPLYPRRIIMNKEYEEFLKKFREEQIEIPDEINKVFIENWEEILVK